MEVEGEFLQVDPSALPKESWSQQTWYSIRPLKCWGLCFFFCCSCLCTIIKIVIPWKISVLVLFKIYWFFNKWYGQEKIPDAQRRLLSAKPNVRLHAKPPFKRGESEQKYWYEAVHCPEQAISVTSEYLASTVEGRERHYKLVCDQSCKQRGFSVAVWG